MSNGDEKKGRDEAILAGKAWEEVKEMVKRKNDFLRKERTERQRLLR